MKTYRATKTVAAVDLKIGDVVKKLPRDDCQFPLTAGRAAIEDVTLVDADGRHCHLTGQPPAYVWVAYAFSSRRCTWRCSDDPVRCPHMNGSAGGGSGRLTVDQQVEVYTGQAS